ncbi:MAG TPA: 3-phenylpropionate/cinnamic acid dioxygenase subunit beta [Mycobacteriales bacterium]
MSALETLALHHEISGFLYREARLLDEERYDDWLALFTEDAHYWVPGVTNRQRRDPIGSIRPEQMAFFDDNLQDLSRRVARYNAETAWAEDPATRHFHLVANIEVEDIAAGDIAAGDIAAVDTDDGAGAGEYVVHSVLLNYRNRHRDEQDVLTARRRDVLRRTGDGLRIVRRKAVLGQSLLLSKNINTFL